MKRITKVAITLGTALTLGLGAMAAIGHPSEGYGPGYGPGYGMGPGMMGGQGWGGAHMGGYGPGNRRGPQGMFDNCAGNSGDGLTSLKTELGITANQDAAWQSFVKNAKQQNENRRARFEKMQKTQRPGSAPELLAQRAEIMQQGLADMQANAAALKDLYAALSPEQKAIADQRFGDFGPGAHHGGRGGPMGYRR